MYHDICCFLQNELTFQDVIKLVLPEAPAEGPDGTKLQTIGKPQLKFISGVAL